jgi:AbrB family looped-hinge helix DNA binding protein
MPRPEFLGSTTVGERGQAVIPQEAREIMNIKKGEKLLVFKLHERGIMMIKTKEFEKMTNKFAATKQHLDKIIRENK